MPGSLRRSLTSPTVLLAIVLLLTACNSSEDEGGTIAGGAIDSTSSTAAEPVETTTTTALETTTTAAPTIEEEVLAAYLSYWQAVDVAFSPPQAQPDLPALRQYATGEVIDIVDAVQMALDEDYVYRIPDGGQYVHRAEVLSVDGDTATVRDCSIDDTIQEVASTGEVIDDAVSTRLHLAMLVWKTVSGRSPC